MRVGSWRRVKTMEQVVHAVEVVITVEVVR
jgi:hypothetical protein